METRKISNTTKIRCNGATQTSWVSKKMQKQNHFQFESLVLPLIASGSVWETDITSQWTSSPFLVWFRFYCFLFHDVPLFSCRTKHFLEIMTESQAVSCLFNQPSILVLFPAKPRCSNFCARDIGYVDLWSKYSRYATSTNFHGYGDPCECQCTGGVRFPRCNRDHQDYDVVSREYSWISSSNFIFWHPAQGDGCFMAFCLLDTFIGSCTIHFPQCKTPISSMQLQ